MTPAEARAAWVAALRSGDYIQTSGTLRRGDSFCCLGVACDVFAKLEPEAKGRWAGVNFINIDPIYRDDVNDAVLPNRVLKWLGLTMSTGGVDLNNEKTSLSHLNDHCGYSFDEIADVIENGKLEIYDAA